MNLSVHLIIYNLVISIFLYGSLAYNPRIMKYHLVSGSKGLVMSLVFSGVLAMMLNL